jgi:hypothetical protein
MEGLPIKDNGGETVSLERVYSTVKNQNNSRKVSITEILIYLRNIGCITRVVSITMINGERECCY